jgi:Pvc16 N-terminal domain
MVASFQAIHATCEAVMTLLRQSYRPDLIEEQLNLLFQVYSTENFKTHMSAGVSLFLYRVYINANQRAPFSVPREGEPNRPLLPLDLHFFLTVWAQEASLQHTILGWAMRTLEDHSVMPASLLNAPHRGVFNDDETVEIVAGQLNNEELMRIWDDLGTEYRLSVPYVARVVRVRSLVDRAGGGVVKRRDFGLGVLE